MENKIKLHDKTFRVLIPAEEIDNAVTRVAEQLNERYEGRTPIFLGVLSGSFLFLADLVRKVNFENQLAFVKISSYNGTESTGNVKQLIGVDFDIEGRDIIIVEDIVDSGMTLSFLKENLLSRGAASLKIVTLLDKPERRRVDIHADYVGASVPDEFIVGYGLDAGSNHALLGDLLQCSITYEAGHRELAELGCVLLE